MNTKEENWKKEFEHDWAYLNGELPKHSGRTKEIKSFISNLLQTQRQEIIRRLKDIEDADSGEIIYNDLLADLRDGNL